MSSHTSIEDEKYSKGDLGKSPQDLTEDVPNIGHPIVNTATTPPALITEIDKGLIAWESQDDPENPLKWPARKRRINLTLISLITFISPLGSSIFAPGIGYTLADLHESSQAVGSLMITIFLLGYSIGPLFLAPLSEMYGRWPVIVGACWFFNAFLLGCSFAQNMPGLIIMRFLAGTGGSAVMAIAPAIVADMYPVERRSFAMAIVLVVQSVSPAAGPIAGGFIAQQLSWRWTYWILLIFSAFITTLITFFMHECYGPAILERKTRRLRKELNRPELRSKMALPVTKWGLLKRSLYRPMKLLTHSPVVILFSLYVACIYGMLYLCLTTVSLIFTDQYGFSIEITGLIYISFAVGMVISLGFLMNTQDKSVAKQRVLNNGVFEPEMRLKNLIYIVAWVGPALIVYGWTAQYHVHWIVPTIALTFFGFGMVGIFMGTQTYVVDSFSAYAASAVAAVTCVRSGVGTFLPFAGPPLFTKLGVGWGNTVLGLIAIMLTPMVLIFRRYGKTIRTRYPVDL
ncbi:synaptic vesicle transporter [Microthyrium microscopicum]|uniref:Synaptic vesicle transporter n=1 Tax=Microthyrium microscopicum TaxID=703497 RepID=A0A6A6U376_9PEZI|nr:synaptic vesicle transporter [Microthyrium microscopicum]